VQHTIHLPRPPMSHSHWLMNFDMIMNCRSTIDFGGSCEPLIIHYQTSLQMSHEKNLSHVSNWMHLISSMIRKKRAWLLLHYPTRGNLNHFGQIDFTNTQKKVILYNYHCNIIPKTICCFKTHQKNHTSQEGKHKNFFL
jgi:hypothetical protein